MRKPIAFGVILATFFMTMLTGMAPASVALAPAAAASTAFTAVTPQTAAPVRVMSYNLCGGASWCQWEGQVAPRVTATRTEVDKWHPQLIFFSEICAPQYDGILTNLSALGYRGVYVKTGETGRCDSKGQGTSTSEGIALMTLGADPGPASRIWDFGEHSAGDDSKMLCADTTLLTRAVKACTFHPSPNVDSNVCPAGSASPQCWGTPADRMVRAARQVMDPWTAAGTPVVFGGDLNLLPESAGMDNFYSHSGGSGRFVEADEVNTDQYGSVCAPSAPRCRSGAVTYDIGKSSQSKIDYAFFDARNFTAAGAAVDPTPEVSDHGAMIGTARWTGCGNPAMPNKDLNPCGTGANSSQRVDVTGDGRDDVVALYDDGNGTSGLWVWSALAGGGFAAPVRWWQSAPGALDWSRSKLVAGDFTGDGKSDVAVLYNSGGYPDGARATSLLTFTSTGSSFSAPVTAWASSGSWTWAYSKPVSGDFNGDGKTDIGVLYDGSPDGASPRVTKFFTFTSTGAGFTAPAVGWDSSSPNIGSWTWSYSKPLTGDFNGDGKTDLAMFYNDNPGTSGIGASSIRLLTSTGSGFNTPSTAWSSSTVGSFTWAYSKPVTGDFNGDGKTDVGVLYDSSPDGTFPRVTKFFTFTSSGTTFADPVSAWNSSNPNIGSWTWASSTPVTGDFNADGRSDLAVLYDQGDFSSGLWQFLSTGPALAAPTKSWDSGSWNTSTSKTVSGDFDGDGRGDVAILHDDGKDSDGANHASLWRLKSTPSGLAPAVKVWDSGPRWTWTSSTPVAGDFNGDGRSDIAVLYNVDSNETQLYTFYSNGGGFNAPVASWPPSTAWNANTSKPVAGDFDGDGKDDLGILYESENADLRGLWELFSTGSGFQAPKRTWPAATGWSFSGLHAVAGDFNGDGKDDLAVKHGAASELVRFTSTGSGMSAPTTVAPGVTGSPVVVGPRTGTASLALIGTVNGTTAVRTVTPFGLSVIWTTTGSWRPGASPVLTGDVNADGQTDLVALSGDATTGTAGFWTLRSSTNGTLDQPVLSQPGAFSARMISVV
ncbi:VCBS repeat-containing protein [Streptomyces sp. ISL-36]|uniref:FG-GAP repeat domain-containing protein n=1 Tax=Streptomyces sp. ISL-36 TaxID=2819182 RepID=UPI001BEC701D|nr:VCBS repeat-containing protein [Streptomyces sp. ISL-36]MBT2442209.1 VCBS repeat-containing protein [Streptomyces sp. ISL-36]